MRGLILFSVLSVWSLNVNAQFIAVCDPSSLIVPNRVARYGDFDGPGNGYTDTNEVPLSPNILVKPNISGLAGNFRNWKCAGVPFDSIVELTQEDKDAITADRTAKILAANRADAISVVTQDSGEGRKWRALFQILSDITRSTSTLTVKEVEAEFQNKITSGDAD